MPFVNYRYFLLLWVCWLGFASDLLAQTPVDPCARVLTPNQPAGAFEAYDVATGQRLDAFCQGQQVRFEPNPARGVDLTTVFYDTTQCTFGPPRRTVFTITSRPGQVNVYENAQNPLD